MQEGVCSPSFFSPLLGFWKGWREGRDGKGLNQHKATVFRPWQTELPLTSLSLPPSRLPGAWPGVKGAKDGGPARIPERNLAGWGLPASHRWGECCQAPGSGRRLRSVGKRRWKVRGCTHIERRGVPTPTPRPPQTPPRKHHLPRCVTQWARDELSEPPLPHL